MIRSYLNSDRYWLIGCWALLIPSLFISLGYMPLMSDEGIRALVALEMDFDGHYFTPTINGAYYFNKPPLYNWLVLAFFKLFNSHSLWVFRLPNVLMGLVFGYLIYRFARFRFNANQSTLTALLFVTCGRVLFNDFQLGLIALTHSALLFLNFMVLYHFYHQKRWTLLFVSSYFIIALTFLMKGLQGPAAQAFTLPAFFLFYRDFKRLFSLQHLVGIFVFGAVLGIYFYLYATMNPEAFSTYLSTLWDQSEQRTFLEYPFHETLLHAISYPLKLIYELLPFGFLAFLLVSRKTIQRLKSDEFLALVAVLFISNNLVYLTSPFWHARYVFFLFPLLLILLLQVWLWHKKDETRGYSILQTVWLSLGGLASVAFLLFPFTSFTNAAPYSQWICLFLGLATLGVTALMWRYPGKRLILLIVVLILGKYGSDLVFIKFYTSQIKEQEHRTLATEVGRFTVGTDLYLFESPYISEDISFYIARERKQTLSKAFGTFSPDAFYIADTRQLERLKQQLPDYTVFKTFKTRNEEYRLKLIQFEKAFSKQ